MPRRRLIKRLVNMRAPHAKIQHFTLSRAAEFATVDILVMGVVVVPPVFCT